MQETLDDAWRPGKPDQTDATCHVFRVDAEDKLLGFFSNYGCHPVIGGAQTRKIHGDWPGVATNIVERLYPGAIGLFLQGAQGDINACRVCSTEPECLQVLDAVAGRYARVILNGLEQARPLTIDQLGSVQSQVVFSRKPCDQASLSALLAEQELILHAPDASDASRELRMAMVYAMALRSLLERLARGDDLAPPVELHGLRLGPVTLLGAPFEIFRAIKNDVVASARSQLPIVMGLTNDSLGYATDHAAAQAGGYETDRVPFICTQLPFANIHDELVQALLELDTALTSQ